MRATAILASGALSLAALLLPAQAIASSSGQTAPCLRALSTLSKGSMAETAAFVPVACPAAVGGGAYEYDRSSGITRLARDVAQGEVLRSFPDYGGESVLPGETLTLVLSIGHVRVARAVEALQRGGPGARLFVRTPDGKILAVRYEADAR